MPSVSQAAGEPPFALAIDVGTSSVRAQVFDRMGRDVEGAFARRTYAMTTTGDGGVEVPAETLLALVEEAIDDVLWTVAPLASGIACVGVSTFWHSLLAVDEAGTALTPIYSWADTRAAGASVRLRRTLDEGRVHARTGAMLHPSYLPSKLVWLYNARRDVFDQAVGWMSFGEFLFLRLFGRAVCSISMASGTGLFDQNLSTWDEEMIGVLPIRRDQLSPLAKDGESLSGLGPEYASRWHALRDVPWFPALGDGACSNVGCGSVSPNRIALTIGTSSAMRVVYESEKIQIPKGLWTYRLDGRRFVIGGALSEGGNLYAWLRGLLRVGTEAEIEAELATFEPDSHGLTVLPFVAGERSTGWAPDARAAVVGMNLDTTGVEIIRAGLEAIAYRFTLITERLPVFVPEDAEIVATGGALRSSPVWAQIVSDVLGRPVRLSAEPESSSRGAALVALEAARVINGLSSIPASFERTFEPDADRHSKYLEAIERQRRLYELVIA
jgi:gluconokinase